MANKSIILVCVLVCAMSMGASKVQGQIPGLPPIPGLPLPIVIGGNVSCTVNATVPGIIAPPFPNATVLLICGNTTVASAITNNNGSFAIELNLLPFALDSLLSSCRLAVITPLSNCNATLPSTGFLTSTLQNAGTTINSVLGFVIDIISSGFSYNVTLSV